MPYRVIHRSIGDTRLNLYTRVLPVTSVVLTLVFLALWIWSMIDGREDRAQAFLVVAIFLAILAVVSLDVSRMLRKLMKSAQEPISPEP